MQADFDVLVIGGGINGCGVARDAAGRGFATALCEQNDLASGTSSGSTKLIHGGLRYLEHYEFLLVRKSLKERETLWAAAPHIIEPRRFILPHHSGLRPAWLLRLGLFLYDHLGGRKKLPATRQVNLKTHAAGQPLMDEFSKGFEYSDCWAHDSRLTILSALDAAEHGAEIMTRSKLVSASRKDGVWEATLRDTVSGEEKTLTARMLINAAGPWIDDVLSDAMGKRDVHNIRLVQGSHIVVPKMFDHEWCYIFQNADERIIFAIPFEQDFTLIGTTDQDYEGDPGAVKCTADEIEYLCDAASEYFKQAVHTEDVVWTYSAVRSLVDDGATKAQEATRDYVLRLETGDGDAPLLNIFGGKITTYRVLAESVLEVIEDNLEKRQPAWTRDASLPGGDFDCERFEDQWRQLGRDYPFLDDRAAFRYTRLYGTRARAFLGNASAFTGHGRERFWVMPALWSNWAQISAAGCGRLK